MATTTVYTTFQFRRGLAATWKAKNIVLAAGEPGFERDTYKLKIGDGTTPWNDLPYFGENENSSIGDGVTIDSENGVIYIVDNNNNKVIIADYTQHIDIESIKNLFT